jgi:hypothetical protein
MGIPLSLSPPPSLSMTRVRTSFPFVALSLVTRPFVALSLVTRLVGRLLLPRQVLATLGSMPRPLKREGEGITYERVRRCECKMLDTSIT